VKQAAVQIGVVVLTRINSQWTAVKVKAVRSTSDGTLMFVCERNDGKHTREIVRSAAKLQTMDYLKNKRAAAAVAAIPTTKNPGADGIRAARAEAVARASVEQLSESSIRITIPRNAEPAAPAPAAQLSTLAVRVLAVFSGKRKMSAASVRWHLEHVSAGWLAYALGELTAAGKLKLVGPLEDLHMGVADFEWELV